MTKREHHVRLAALHLLISSNGKPVHGQSSADLERAITIILEALRKLQKPA